MKHLIASHTLAVLFVLTSIPLNGSANILNNTFDTELTRDNMGTTAMAEFEPADGIVFVWDNDYAEMFVEIVETLYRLMDIYILLYDKEEHLLVTDVFLHAGIDPSLIHFIFHTYDSLWVRDYGPISVQFSDGQVAFADSEYLEDRPYDDSTPFILGEYLGIPVISTGIKLDGGNFLSNGQGLCVMTDQTIESNPEISENTLHAHLERHFGCKRIIVLDQLLGEQTGHVDMFAKFISPTTILVGSYDEEIDPINAVILDDNAEFLESLTIRENMPLSVVRIPMAKNEDGVFRSYVNSLYVNETILVPTYADDRTNERTALDIYRSILPDDTQIVPIEVGEVIKLNGAIHCLIQSFVY